VELYLHFPICLHDIRGNFTFTFYLRVSQNRALRIFGPKRDEVIRGWRKMYDSEHHKLYFPPSIIIMIKIRRIDGHSM
jgi:hypothetical protein